MLPAQRLHATEERLRVGGAGLRRGEVGAGLGDVFAARAGLQFGEHVAGLPRLCLHGRQLRLRAGQFELHQPRTGRDALPLAHVDADDLLRRRRRQRDAVPFQRAQACWLPSLQPARASTNSNHRGVRARFKTATR